MVLCPSLCQICFAIDPPIGLRSPPLVCGAGCTAGHAGLIASTMRTMLRGCLGALSHVPAQWPVANAAAQGVRRHAWVQTSTSNTATATASAGESSVRAHLAACLHHGHRSTHGLAGGNSGTAHAAQHTAAASSTTPATIQLVVRGTVNTTACTHTHTPAGHQGCCHAHSSCPPYLQHTSQTTHGRPLSTAGVRRLSTSPPMEDQPPHRRPKPTKPSKQQQKTDARRARSPNNSRTDSTKKRKVVQAAAPACLPYFNRENLATIALDHWLFRCRCPRHMGLSKLVTLPALSACVLVLAW